MTDERLLSPIKSNQLSTIYLYQRAEILVADLEAQDGDYDSQAEHAEITTAVDHLAEEASINWNHFDF